MKPKGWVGAPTGAQRLEVITGGLAHELINPLAVIDNGSRLLLDSLEAIARVYADDPVVSEASERARTLRPALRASLDRITSVVDQMRRYAHQGYPQRAAPVSVGAVVRRAAQGVSVAIAPEEAQVLMVPDELDLVVRNLVANAVRVAEHVVVWVALDEHQVEIVVIDDGPGIPAAIQERIFLPFFTTQPRGEGLGLGLGLVRQIVENAGGSVVVESDPGEGSTFRVRLPRL